MAKLDKAKLGKAKKQNVGKLPLRPGRKGLKPEDVAAAREYIAGYWTKGESVTTQRTTKACWACPNRTWCLRIREKTGFDYNELYYWDSYFMVQGCWTRSTRRWSPASWRI